jgi:serpin B
MKKDLAILLVCFTALLGCNHKKDNPVAPPNDQSGGSLSVLEKSIVASDNSFGFKLFSKINNTELNKNVFISPFSVSMAFGMVLNGANGATLDSLKQALGDAGLSLDEINNSYKNISSTLTSLDATVVFQNANSIWYRFGFPVLPKFLNDNRNYFDAEVDSLDFTQSSAVQTINGWVNTKTNGKIPTILNNIPPHAMMYLINAIYYKGMWTYQFNSQYTKNTSFTCTDGSSVSCKLMSEEATFAYYADANMQVIDLPYGNRSFSMTIILPNANISIDQFVAGLTQAQWDAIVGKLDSSKVDLYMPKFTLAYSKSLNDELKALGMEIAFSGAADFSHISQTSELYISDVLHKTFVEVDEEGTEAAAVTIIVMPTGRSNPSPPAIPIMRIDHPYIFAIREHQSGTILFIGKIVNPAAQ